MVKLRADNRDHEASWSVTVYGAAGVARSCGASWEGAQATSSATLRQRSLVETVPDRRSCRSVLDCSRNRGPTLAVLTPHQHNFFGGVCARWYRADGAMQSDRYSVAVELVILVVATFARAKIGEIVYELNGCNPLDHLEA